jgi:hypothetical protein
MAASISAGLRRPRGGWCLSKGSGSPLSNPDPFRICKSAEFCGFPASSNLPPAGKLYTAGIAGSASLLGVKGKIDSTIRYRIVTGFRLQNQKLAGNAYFLGRMVKLRLSAASGVPGRDCQQPYPQRPWISLQEQGNPGVCGSNENIDRPAKQGGGVLRPRRLRTCRVALSARSVGRGSPGWDR